MKRVYEIKSILNQISNFRAVKLFNFFLQIRHFHISSENVCLVWAIPNPENMTFSSGQCHLVPGGRPSR